LKSSYDKYPKVKINGFAGHCQSGWNDITLQLKQNISENRRHVIVIETYPGVNDTEILQAIREELKPDSLIIASDAWLSPEEIDALAYPDVTDDRIFGYMTRLTIDRFFEPEKLDGLRRDLKTMHGLTVIYGTGAALICEEPDTLVYADMARWEIQLRMRRHEVSNLGANNRGLEVSRMYKRAYFVDWSMADRLKKEVMPRMDYLLDTNKAGSPRMVSATAFRAALEEPHFLRAFKSRYYPLSTELYRFNWERVFTNDEPAGSKYGLFAELKRCRSNMLDYLNDYEGLSELL
jgi:hypothetical protein